MGGQRPGTGTRRGDAGGKTDAILQRVEQRLIGMEVGALRPLLRCTRPMGSDVIGMLQFSLSTGISAVLLAPFWRIWLSTRCRRAGFQTGDGPRRRQAGAGSEYTDPDIADAGVDQITAMMRNLGGFTDIQDNRSLPGVSGRCMWIAYRCRMGTDIATIGSAVQLLPACNRHLPPQTVNDEVNIRSTAEKLAHRTSLSV